VVLGVTLVTVLAHIGTVVVASVGGDAIISAEGLSPEVSPVVIGLAVALLGLGWAAAPPRPVDGSRRTYMVRGVVLILVYVAALAVAEAARTTGPPHYGARKLLFVVSGVWVTLLLADILLSQARAARPLEMALAAAAAVVVAVSVQGGPVYVAIQSRWPAAAAVPTWATVLANVVQPGDHVACLTTLVGQPAEDATSNQAYLCSRWGESLAGSEGPDALAWRLAMLGRTPVSAAIPFLHPNDGHPVKLIVLGPTDRLDDPAAWWAQLVNAPGVTVIAAR